jgi:hypothetical protein
VIGFIRVSAARELSAEVMGCPRPRGAAVGCVRAAEDGKAVCCCSRSVIANVCWLRAVIRPQGEQASKGAFFKAIDELSSGWLACTHTKKCDRTAS